MDEKRKENQSQELLILHVSQFLSLPVGIINVKKPNSSSFRYTSASSYLISPLLSFSLVYWFHDHSQGLYRFPSEGEKLWWWHFLLVTSTLILLLKSIEIRDLVIINCSNHWLTPPTLKRLHPASRCLTMISNPILTSSRKKLKKENK